MTRKPSLPDKAKKEICDILQEHKHISSAELDAILKKHKVRGNTDSLQRAYRLRVAQRFVSSIKDDDGRREILAAPVGRETKYIIINACNDEAQLKSIQQRIAAGIYGLERSALKVSMRSRLLNNISYFFVKQNRGETNAR